MVISRTVLSHAHCKRSYHTGIGALFTQPFELNRPRSLSSKNDIAMTEQTPQLPSGNVSTILDGETASTSGSSGSSAQIKTSVATPTPQPPSSSGSIAAGASISPSKASYQVSSL